MEKDETPIVDAGTRKEWRAWLQKNHNKENKVYLIKHKKHTGKPTLNNKEAMEEAICFGWIDTIVKKLDEERYRQTFVRRNKNSRWSNNTLRYAKEMIEQGKISPVGMNVYLEGLKKPTIDHNLPKNPGTPEDLKKQLEKSRKAKEFFNNLAPSYKRVYIYRIEKAKLPETRKKRIKQVLKNCKEGKKFGM
jgi:uncharacterized protein YdeI (YjbR/CyaY-like superfamily)